MRNRNNSMLGIIDSLSSASSIGYIENAMTGALLKLNKFQLEELKHKYSYAGFLCSGELTGARIGNQFFYTESDIKCDRSLLLERLKRVLADKQGVFYYDFEKELYCMYPLYFCYGSSIYSVNMFSTTDPDHTNTIYLIHKLTYDEIEQLKERETVCQ